MEIGPHVVQFPPRTSVPLANAASPGVVPCEVPATVQSPSPDKLNVSVTQDFIRANRSVR